MVRMLLPTLMLSASLAHADVLSLEEGHCQGKEAGDACEEGVCVQETCSRSRPTPDGTIDTSTYPCLMCRPGEPGGSTLRIVIALGVAAVVIGGGVVLARKRMKRSQA